METKPHRKSISWFMQQTLGTGSDGPFQRSILILSSRLWRSCSKRRAVRRASPSSSNTSKTISCLERVHRSSYQKSKARHMLPIDFTQLLASTTGQWRSGMMSMKRTWSDLKTDGASPSATFSMIWRGFVQAHQLKQSTMAILLTFLPAKMQASSSKMLNYSTSNTQNSWKEKVRQRLEKLLKAKTTKSHTPLSHVLAILSWENTWRISQELQLVVTWWWS